MMECVLQDGDEESGGSVRVRVEKNGDFLEIYPEGYGEATAMPGYGAPVILELFMGHLRLIVAKDITTEYPTIIDLEGARERPSRAVIGLVPLPPDEDVDLMTLAEWDTSVTAGAFCPDDGSGCYATETHMHRASYKVFDKSSRPVWATHIAWFNK